MKSYQFAPVDLIIETSNESRSYILTTDLTSRTNYKPFCDEIEYFLKNRENDTFLAAINNSFLTPFRLTRLFYNIFRTISFKSGKPFIVFLKKLLQFL